MAGSESLCQCLVVAHLAAYIYPYRILVKKEYKIFHFYIHPVLLAIFFCLQSTSGFAHINGWIRIVKYVRLGGRVAYF